MKSTGAGRNGQVAWVRVRLLGSPVANAALAVLVLVASFLAAALPLTMDRNDDTGLRQQLAGLPVSTASINGAAIPVVAPGVSAASQVDLGLLAPVARALASGVPAPLNGLPDQSSYGVTTTAPAAAAALPRLDPLASTQLDLVAQADADQHATLLHGSWPVDQGPGTALETAVNATTAAKLGLHVGSVIDTSLGALRVVGVYRPTTPTGPYWTAQPFLTAPGVAYTPGGINGPPTPYWHISLLLSDDAAVALPLSSLQLYWHQALDTRALHAYQIGPALRELASLLGGAQAQHVFNVSETAGVPAPQLTSQLPTVLGEVQMQQAAVVPLLTIGGAGAAGSAVAVLLMLAVLAAERRGEELRLLRARGVSLRWLFGRLLAENAAIGVPAAAIGTGAALLLLPGPRPGPSLAAAGAVVLITVLGLPLRAVLRHRRPTPGSDREELATARPGKGRLLLELGALALAVLAAVGLRLHGTSTGGSLDPLVALAPPLLALAAALLVVRLLPLPLRRLGRALGRGRGAVSFLGTARIGRAGTGVAVLPLLALLLALSTAALGSTVLASVDAGRDRAATLAVGGDTRIDGSPQLAPGFPAAIAAVPGVQRLVTLREMTRVTAPVTNDAVTPPVLTVVGVDPAQYAAYSKAVDIGAFDPALLQGAGSTGKGAAPIITSPDVFAVFGSSPFQISVTTGTLDVRIVGTLTGTPGIAPGGSFALLPQAAELSQLAVSVPPTQYAQNVVLTLDHADPATLAAAAVRATGGFYAPVGIQTRAQVLASLATTPTQRLAEQLYRATVAAAALFSLLALVLSLVQAAPGRAALLTRLRTMGLTPRQGYALSLTESLPSVLVAAVAGALLTVGLTALLGPALDIGALIGTTIPIPLVTHATALLTPTALLALLAALVVLAETALITRRHINTELRAGDRR